jgi:hypothetical protein
MTFFTMTTTAFGFLLCAVAGLVCGLGSGGLGQHLEWLPHANLLLSNPQAAFGAGVLMILVGLVLRPSCVR